MKPNEEKWPEIVKYQIRQNGLGKIFVYEWCPSTFLADDYFSPVKTYVNFYWKWVREFPAQEEATAYIEKLRQHKRDEQLSKQETVILETEI